MLERDFYERIEKNNDGERFHFRILRFDDDSVSCHIRLSFPLCSGVKKLPLK